MEVDRREVRRPRDLRDLRHAELVGMPPGREGDARRLDPVRPLLRHALLVDRLALGAVRVPLQLRRALVQRADDALADGHVVLDVVELGRFQLALEGLVGVRHLDGATADFELDERGPITPISPFLGIPVSPDLPYLESRCPQHTPAPVAGRFDPSKRVPRFWGRITEGEGFEPSEASQP